MCVGQVRNASRQLWERVHQKKISGAIVGGSHQKNGAVEFYLVNDSNQD